MVFKLVLILSRRVAGGGASDVLKVFLAAASRLRSVDHPRRLRLFIVAVVLELFIAAVVLELFIAAIVLEVFIAAVLRSVSRRSKTP